MIGKWLAKAIGELLSGSGKLASSPEATMAVGCPKTVPTVPGVPFPTSATAWAVS
jgi:hypothetical protein